jgi:uncharacterized protein YegL
MTSYTLWAGHAYNDADDAYCKNLCNALNTDGYAIAMFNYGGGFKVQAPLDEIEKRSVFIMLLSSAALESDEVFNECQAAYRKKKKHSHEYHCYIVFCDAVDAHKIRSGRLRFILQREFTQIGAPSHPVPYTEAVYKLKRELPQSQPINGPAPTSSAFMPAQPLLRRYPIFFLLDVSSSMNYKMQGEAEAPLQVLQQGFATLLAQLDGDPEVNQLAFLGMITFSHETSYVPLAEFVAPNLVAAHKHGTQLGEGLRRFRDAYHTWRTAHPNNYIPTLIVFTDGFPSDDWPAALHEVKNDISLFTSLGVGCGPHADTQILRNICELVVSVPVFSSDYFQQFSQWMARSIVQSVTTGQPAFAAEVAHLPPGINVMLSSDPT